MHYIIDGYNLFFQTTGQIKNLRAARERFIEKLYHRTHLLKLHITIIFDAHLHDDTYFRTRYKEMEILYTDYQETADEKILSFIRTQNPKETILVTSDRELARKAKMYGIQIQSCDTFLRSLSKKRSKQKKRPKKTEEPDYSSHPLFSYYLKLFEEKDDSES